MIRYIVTFFLAVYMLGLSACQSDEQKNKPLVISTIQPIHLLVKAIAPSNIDTQLLLPAETSPHQFTLKPSDLRKLKQAQLIFRIDEHFESLLNAALHNPERVVSLNTQNIHTIKLRTYRAPHDHQHEQDAKTSDLHIWLNPQNAVIMARSIEKHLSQAFPEYKTELATNTQQLIDTIQAKDQSIKQQLSQVKQRGFLTFHDSFQHFEKRYSLKFSGVVMSNLSHQLGAKHLKSLLSRIKQDDLGCIFYEPQFPQRIVDTLSTQAKIKAIHIDPLGSTLTKDQGYPELLQQVADSFSQCLAQ